MNALGPQPGSRRALSLFGGFPANSFSTIISTMAWGVGTNPRISFSTQSLEQYRRQDRVLLAAM